MRPARRSHYRTLRGFAALVEKEWFGFGHCFDTRGGRRGPASKTSPVFEQFLDAVWQLTRQAPAAFEFGEELLVALAAEARRGAPPFRCDSAAERATIEPVAARTLWDSLRAHAFTRPIEVEGVLTPRTDAASLGQWERLFRLAAMRRGESEYSI